MQRKCLDHRRSEGSAICVLVSPVERLARPDDDCFAVDHGRDNLSSGSWVPLQVALASRWRVFRVVLPQQALAAGELEREMLVEADGTI